MIYKFEMYEVFEQYVREHYKSAVSVKDMARDLYISPAYLGVMFKRHFGVTLKTYVHSMRMEKIVEGMADENSLIKDLAYEAGYNNYNNFFLWFRRFFDISPEEFRERMWLI